DQVPIDWAADIYCVVLNQCHRLADLPRMRAWTQSMERWCNDFAASANYGGVCDVHRLQLSAATDDYGLLEHRLVRASRELEEVNSWAAGEGYYQLGEVRRLRGDADGAFAAFSRARALGVEPQPGEALLRCAIGHSDTAWMKPKDIAVNWNPVPKRSVRPAFARGRRTRAVHCWCSRAGTGKPSTPWRRRFASTGYSNRATTPRRSMTGWPWPTRHSVTTSWPPPTPPPRRTSTPSSVSSRHRSAGRGRPAVCRNARSTSSGASRAAPPTNKSP